MSAQELYQLEKARRADRIAPAMQEAAAELKRQQELAVAARKGGRPKGADLKLGKNRIPRARLLDVTDDAPGRPDRLPITLPDAARRNPSIVTKTAALLASPVAPRPTVAAQPLSSESAMSNETRTATECGHDTPKRAGPPPKLCDVCKGSPKSSTKLKQKRARAETGFQRRAPAPKGKNPYRDTIASMLAEADVLETRRTQLLAAVEHLELLGRLA